MRLDRVSIPEFEDDGTDLPDDDEMHGLSRERQYLLSNMMDEAFLVVQDPEEEAPRFHLLYMVESGDRHLRANLLVQRSADSAEVIAVWDGC